VIINASAHNMPLADKSVHAAVSSPPYFGLRRYSGAQDIDWPAGVYAPMTGCPPCVEVPAMRASLGNEPTIEGFIFHLLLVMRELRRVLRDDGVCWINLGDSFSAESTHGGAGKAGIHGHGEESAKAVRGSSPRSDRIGQGNLLAIPHRFALAAQADGWTLRNDCVWAKKSAMPESVAGWKFQDGQLRRGSWRHTRAQEYVFQFTKGMGYWSDSEIVKEMSTMQIGAAASFKRETKDHLIPNQSAAQHRIDRADVMYSTGRNPRSVFSPSPSPYKDAHYATFPKELIRPLILSSVPRRCCPECGQGWAAVVEREQKAVNKKEGAAQRLRCAGAIGGGTANVTLGVTHLNTSSISGYRPTCDCGRSGYVSGICLDPFVGSGTTLEVARECGVRAIGLDISHEYLNEQASWRGLQIAKPDFSKMPLFTEVA